jgi:hypothetical protein
MPILFVTSVGKRPIFLICGGIGLDGRTCTGISGAEGGSAAMVDDQPN